LIMKKGLNLEQTQETDLDRRTGGERRSGVDRRYELSRESERLLAQDQSHISGRASMCQETMLINEISFKLAEKRTSLSVMRTGLAVVALPLSVFSVLIVISRYYDPGNVMYLLGPLLGICVGLAILGIYLILSSLRRIHALNRVIAVLKGRRGKTAI